MKKTGKIPEVTGALRGDGRAIVTILFATPCQIVMEMGVAKGERKGPAWIVRVQK